MSSSALSPISAPPVNASTTTHPPSRTPQRRLIVLIVFIGVVGVVALLAAVAWNRIWPFTESAVVQDLAEASDSTVTIRSSRRTYFPVPGCILEGVEFHHGPKDWPLITIDKLTIEGSYLGILTKHVPLIKAEGGRVSVPPFGSGTTFSSQHSNLVVDELVANGAVVEFAMDDAQKRPLRFDVYDAVLHGVRWGTPLEYELKLHNPQPPGELTVRGKFGAWTTGTPGETPISGEYTFERADLGVYGGVAGILSSSGKFGGHLEHVDISGTTDVPDFEVRSGGHKVKLTTQFDAYVDAIHGDTFLKSVNAHFGRTNLAVAGSIARAKTGKGKVAQLNLTSLRGRIEDILGLFVKAPHSPMRGLIAFKAKVEIPSGKEPFLRKVKLQGAFGIDDGSFSKPETQKNVNELSAGARGDKMEDADTVLTDLKGEVVLNDGAANFSDLSFGVPGADAKMYGTYNLITEKIDLHGRMRVDTKISKTSSGFKSFLLKAIDPIFKKKNKGEIVPVHISGTYDHPQFGLDLNQPKTEHPSK
jgi:hypothetical protein